MTNKQKIAELEERIKYLEEALLALAVKQQPQVIIVKEKDTPEIPITTGIPNTTPYTPYNPPYNTPYIWCGSQQIPGASGGNSSFVVSGNITQTVSSSNCGKVN